MSFTTTCPFCDAKVSLPSQLANRKVRCAECDKAFRADPQSAPKHQSNVAKIVGLLLVVVILGIGGFWLWHERQELERADELFAAGNRDEAVALYEQHFGASKNKPQVLQRIVDHEATRGNATEARKWIDRGIAEKIRAQFESAEAAAIVAQVQRERADEQRKQDELTKAKQDAARAQVEAREKKVRAEEPFKLARAAINADARFLRPRVGDMKPPQQHDGRWQIVGSVSIHDPIADRRRIVPFVVWFNRSPDPAHPGDYIWQVTETKVLGEVGN